MAKGRVLDDRSGSPPRHQAAWCFAASAATLLVPGAAALLAHRVLLFPSLGPSAVMQAHDPAHRASRPYNLLVSHLVGMTAAYAMVFVFGLAHAPSVFAAGEVSVTRVAAAVLAVGLSAMGEVAFDAAHPPAASTTLLVALGSFCATWDDALLIVAGVLLVTAAGEPLRRFRLRTMRPRADAPPRPARGPAAT